MWHLFDNIGLIENRKHSNHHQECEESYNKDVSSHMRASAFLHSNVYVKDLKIIVNFQLNRCNDACPFQICTSLAKQKLKI